MLTKTNKPEISPSVSLDKRPTDLLERPVKFSFIVPIVERYDDLEELYTKFSEEVGKVTSAYEFIFVVDGGYERLIETLKQLKEKHANIKIIKFSRSFGESVALSAGFEKAQGKWMITLPAYFQIEPYGITQVIEALEQGYDLVTTRRFPRFDSFINRMHTKVFHWLVETLIGFDFNDFGCGVRGMNREVTENIHLYGDMFRFIPALASKQGFRVKEVAVAQNKKDTKIKVYNPWVYFKRLLDILTLFFLIKFTRKPLRFFGLIGSVLSGVGFLLSAYLTVQRLLGLTAIADRPVLLLGVLLMVLGIQSISIGLLGEIIIFTHAGEVKEYKVDEFIE